MKFFMFTEKGSTIFINLAHIVKAVSHSFQIEIHLVDGSKHMVSSEQAKLSTLLKSLSA